MINFFLLDQTVLKRVRDYIVCMYTLEKRSWGKNDLEHY